MQSISFTKAAGGLLLLALTLATSCGDILDEQPFSQTSDAQFWQNNGDAASGVAAIYDAMQQTYRRNHYLWGEFRSDNFIASDRVSVTNEELVTNQLTQSNADVLRWNDLYQMIGRANLAIQKIPTIPNFTPQLLGEAHVLRAYAYFDAVRVWGRVPLYTEPVIGLGQDLTRPATEGDIIMREVVLPDLERAAELITSSGTEFRFTKAALWALQGDVFTYLKDYDRAKEALDKIIALNEYELVTDRESWSRLFLNDLNLGQFQEGPELIFSIRYDLLEDGNGASGNYALFFAGIPSFFISPTLERKWIEKFPVDSAAWVAKYPDFEPQETDEFGNTLFGDWRYFESREDRPIGEARAAKYTKINFSANDDQTNIPVYRYAGVLLLKALVENRLGNAAVAIELVNEVRTARQLPLVDAADYPDTESLELLVLDERQLELFAEGDRWWDLRATDRVRQALDTIATIPEGQLVFPIWEGHLIDNPNLTQNPGYIQ
ncbi:SusD-like protein P38 [Neolewinella maritima]|uniref:SusD-like protein P38 n=1 Tax=Neolewinella maritima TaxID=1383882 RepID=A0ABM9AXF6_9BACT|nr:RagB/SusD family nutrient uptake outer membrane protein [Neolewinella maritima]CAH0999391.1 SusD-like protein P38 [Neolewinella maritima]